MSQDTRAQTSWDGYVDVSLLAGMAVGAFAVLGLPPEAQLDWQQY